MVHAGLSVAGLDGGLGNLNCFDAALTTSEGLIDCDDALVPG